MLPGLRAAQATHNLVGKGEIDSSPDKNQTHETEESAEFNGVRLSPDNHRCRDAILSCTIHLWTTARLFLLLALLPRRPEFPSALATKVGRLIQATRSRRRRSILITTNPPSRAAS